MNLPLPQPADRPDEPGRPPAPPTRDGAAEAHPTGPYQPVTLAAPVGAASTRPLPGTRPAPDAHPVPTLFGDYELLREIRRGGMGVVYEARHVALGRTVALKMMRLEVDGDPGVSVNRFQVEAQAVAQLNHPHIVAIHDFGRQEGRYYFTMTLAVGSLDRRAERYRADPRATAALVEKIARAVHYAHEKGILHRDLKPANVLIDERDEPLVSDFGLAKVLQTDSALTQTGAVLGTPSYMAPEQAAGLTPKIGRATDVWALGVILHELLAERRPFVGESNEEVKRLIRLADPAPLRELCPKLDPALATVVMKCLRKDPPERYATAAALADDLGRWLRGESVLARPEPWTSRLRRTVRRRGLAGPLLGLLTGLVVVLAALPVLVRPREEKSPLVDIQQALGRGEEVALIGDGGRPAWSRWVLGGGSMEHSPDGVFRVQAVPNSLLELLPRPLPETYTFSAEVRHDANLPVQSKPEGPIPFELRPAEVGVFFGYNLNETTPQRRHSFCKVFFSDIPTEAKQRPAKTHSLTTLKVHHHREPGPAGGGTAESSTWAAKRYPYPQPADSSMPWRSLVVKVTPEAVEVFWDGVSLGVLTRPVLMQSARRALLEGSPELDPEREFSLRGGLGLFVYKGSASYRNVRVATVP